MHKHVALLALLTALKRKDKPFLFVDTHAGGGDYDLAGSDRRSDRIAASEPFLHQAQHSSEPEIAHFARAVIGARAGGAGSHRYPGSPLLAAAELRIQDRGVFFELDPLEAERLRARLPRSGQLKAERCDGFERLRSVLPPPERRGLILIDPPYESATDEIRIGEVLQDALRRFPAAVIAVWYPIKEAREAQEWLQTLLRRIDASAACMELWMYARDSRVSLNGSGIFLVNPPYLTISRAAVWQRELVRTLGGGQLSGSRVEEYNRSGPKEIP